MSTEYSFKRAYKHDGTRSKQIVNKHIRARDVMELYPLKLVNTNKSVNEEVINASEAANSTNNTPELSSLASEVTRREKSFYGKHSLSLEHNSVSNCKLHYCATSRFSKQRKKANIIYNCKKSNNSIVDSSCLTKSSTAGEFTNAKQLLCFTVPLQCSNTCKQSSKLQHNGNSTSNPFLKRKIEDANSESWSMKGDNNYVCQPEKMQGWGVNTEIVNAHSINTKTNIEYINVPSRPRESDTTLHQEVQKGGRATEIFVGEQEKQQDLHEPTFMSHFHESRKSNEIIIDTKQSSSSNSYHQTSEKIDKAVNSFGKRADALGTFLQTVGNRLNKANFKHKLANGLLAHLKENDIDNDINKKDTEKSENAFASLPEQRFDLVRVNRLSAVQNYNRGVFVGWNRLHAPLQMWMTRSGRLIIGAHPSTQSAITSNRAGEAYNESKIKAFSSIDGHACLACNEEHEPIPSSLKYYEQLIARSSTMAHNNGDNEKTTTEEHSEHTALADQWVFPSTQTFRCFDDANGLLSFMWLNVAGTLSPQEINSATTISTSSRMDSSHLVEINTLISNQELQQSSTERELSEEEYAKMYKYKLEATLSSEDKEFIATLVSAMCKRYRAKLTEAEKEEAKRLLRLRREQGKWKSERQRELGHRGKGTLTSLHTKIGTSEIDKLHEYTIKSPYDNLETNVASTANNTQLQDAIDKLISNKSNNNITETAVSVHTSHMEKTKPLPLLEITKEDNIVRPLTGTHRPPLHYGDHHHQRISFDHTLTSDEAARLHITSPFASLESPHSVNVPDNPETDEFNNNASKSNIFSNTLPGSALHEAQLISIGEEQSSENENKSTSLSLAKPQSCDEHRSSSGTPPSSISIREVSSTHNSITRKSKDLSNWLGELDHRQKEYNDVMQLNNLVNVEPTIRPRERRTTESYTDAQYINNNRDDKVNNVNEDDNEDHTMNLSTTQYEELEESAMLLEEKMANRDSKRNKKSKVAQILKIQKEKRKMEQRVPAVLHSLDELSHELEALNNNDNNNKSLVKQEELSDRSKYEEELDTKVINLAGDVTGHDKETKAELLNSMESTLNDKKKRIRHENKAVLDDFNDTLLDQNPFYGKTLNMPGFFSNSELYFSPDDDNDDDDEIMRARRAVLREWNESNAKELSKQQNVESQENENDESKVVGFTVTQEQLIEKFRNEAEEFYSTLANKRNDLRHEAEYNAMLRDNFTKDVERLSVGIADEMSAEEFALGLTREVNEYAKAHHLHWTSLNFNHTNNTSETNDHETGTAGINSVNNDNDDNTDEEASSHATHAPLQKRKSLQPEDMDANYLRQLFEGNSIITKNATCQVNDVDVGYIDSTRRATESSMEDMFTHEARLMQSVKLATIAIANIMSFHASLELEATCKHCFCIFDSPRTLWPCGHTFCAHCLPDMYNSDDELICAECHSICEVGYTPNVSLEMMASYQVIQDGNEFDENRENSISSWNEHGLPPPTTTTKPLSLSVSTHQVHTRERESVASSGSSGSNDGSGGNRFMAKNVLYNNIANRNGPKMTVERVLRHLLNDLLSIQSKLYAEG